MQNLDEIRQQPVGTERGFFVKQGQLDITAIDLFLAIGLELVVAMMLAQQLTIGDEVVTTETEQPDVALPCPVQDRLERQRNASAMLVVSPGILALGVFQHLSDGAVSARYIPDGTGDLIQYDGAFYLRGLCHLFQRLVTAVNHSE